MIRAFQSEIQRALEDKRVKIGAPEDSASVVIAETQL
jgi:hypothetical protein